MSVDIINPPRTAEEIDKLARYAERLGTIQDIVIEVIGWFGGHNGEPNTGDDQKAEPFKKALMDDPAYGPTHKSPIVRNWFGSNQGANNLADMEALIRKHFDPRGKLILVGSSRGGHNIVQLCNRLQIACGFFFVGPDAQGAPDGRPGILTDQQGSTFATMRLRVDLVWLMDATFDTPTVGQDSKIPGIVRQRGEGFQQTDNNKQITRLETSLDSSQTNNLGSVRHSPPTFMSKTAHDWCIEQESPRKDRLVRAELMQAVNPFAKFKRKQQTGMVRPFKTRAIYQA